MRWHWGASQHRSPIPPFQVTAPQRNRRNKTSRSKPVFSGLTRIDIYVSVLQARHSFCHRHWQDTVTSRAQTPTGHRDQLHNVLSQSNTKAQRSLLKTETVKANTKALDHAGALPILGSNVIIRMACRRNLPWEGLYWAVEVPPATLIQENLNAASAAIMLEMKGQTCLGLESSLQISHC